MKSGERQREGGEGENECEDDRGDGSGMDETGLLPAEKDMHRGEVMKERNGVVAGSKCR